MAFNPNEHLTDLKGKAYLEVKWRLVDIQEQSELFCERAGNAQRVLRLSDNPYADKYLSRFVDRIRVADGGCWLWKSTLNNKGYARMGMHRRLVLMHRWSYLLFVGDIPQGTELDHTCRNPSCVNPDHLDPVTHRENNLRGNSPSARHARTTVCPQGHPLTPENTYTKPSGNSRECRICKHHRTIESNRRMNALRKGGEKTA